MEDPLRLGFLRRRPRHLNGSHHTEAEEVPDSERKEVATKSRRHPMIEAWVDMLPPEDAGMSEAELAHLMAHLQLTLALIYRTYNNAGDGRTWKQIEDTALLKTNESRAELAAAIAKGQKS